MEATHIKSPLHRRRPVVDEPDGPDFRGVRGSHMPRVTEGGVLPS